jgi:hypothetical protein
MKFQLLLLIGLFALGMQACKPTADTNSPEATFRKLVKAIQEKDIDTYATCWAAESAEREGQVSKLKENPKMWDELQAMFKGPQTLDPDGSHVADGVERMKFEVQSPEVPDGRGIGTISMIKENGVWKMNSW